MAECTHSNQPLSSDSAPSKASARSSEALRRLQSYPAIVHAAFVSAILLPIAALPYFAARHHIVALRQRVKSLEGHIQLLRGDLDSASAYQSSTNSDLHRLRATTRKTLERCNEVRDQINLQEADRLASHEALRTDLRALIEDSRSSRMNADTLHGLGMSLADIAAFMEEVDSRFGLHRHEHQHRVEQIRSLALQVHNIPKPKVNDEEPNS